MLWKLEIVVSIISSSFLVNIFWIVLKQSLVYKCEKKSSRLTESFRVLYNAKLDDECEIELKD